MDVLRIWLLTIPVAVLLASCATNPGDPEAAEGGGNGNARQADAGGDWLKVTGEVERYLEDAKAINRHIRIFSQALAFRHSAEWRVAYEQATADSYIMELIPEDQTLKSWTEMITVQGFRGFGTKHSTTPVALLKSIAVGIKESCTTDFVYEPLGDRVVDSWGAYLTIIGCGNGKRVLPGVDPRPGEVAWFLAIKGRDDMYLIQQAVRGDRFSKKRPPIDKKRAERMLFGMQPVKLCDLSMRPPECASRKAK